jgi:flagellin-like protein
LFFFNLFVNSKPFFKKRRGLSQVIGSLLLLAIVVPLGTVLLVNGTTQINAFNNEMSSLVWNTQGIREELIFEHIRFDPPTGDVTISLRNTGSVETIIDRVTLVNMTDQKILFKIDGMSAFVPITISIKSSTDITIDANPEGGSWDSASIIEKEYKISIITARGNFFDTVARPYNT